MSFLNRFQGKIATVTAQGHLKKADGSEEIRVGPPKRRSQRQPHRAAQAPSNNDDVGRVVLHSKAESSTPRGTGAGRASGTHAMPPPPVQTQRSPPKQSVSLSPAASPRNRANIHDGSVGGAAVSNNYERSRIPGRVRDDYGSVHQSVHSTKSPTKGTQPQECRSPKEINESRVVTDADQLAFSRKARPVHYEPCKLSQYKKEKPDGYYELGKLQPDLNADHLVQKRANAERIKAFSKNLRQINKTAQTRKTVDPAVPPKPASTRDKALAFAKRVPKPRPAPHQRHAEEQDHSARSPSPSPMDTELCAVVSASDPLESAFEDDSDDELSAELLQLQQRHQASRAQVDALMAKS